MAIQNSIFSGNFMDEVIPVEPAPKLPKVISIISTLTNTILPSRTNTAPQLEDKYLELESAKFQHSLRSVAPRLTFSLAFHRTKRSISNAWKAWKTKDEPPPNPSQLMLQRIGSTRKLVTSLVRLLATKSDVLTAFRKRLMRVAVLKSKLVTGRSSDELELVIYSGDVQG
jgi:Mg2+ and Co2+ transporter CorA